MKLVYIPFNDVILELVTWSVPKWVDTKKSKWICDTETNKPYYTSKLNPLRNPAHCVQEDCSRGVYFLSYNYLPPPPRWKIIFSLDIMCFCEVSKKYKKRMKNFPFDEQFFISANSRKHSHGGGRGVLKNIHSGSQGVKLQCSILVYLESFRIF